MPQPKTRLAVVDDDASVRKALGRILSIADFEVETFACARELLGALEHRTYNCLVIDLQLPEVSGLELFTRLRETSVTIPAIFITAQAEASSRQRCKAAGASAFLLKPLKELVLVSAIKAALLR